MGKTAPMLKNYWKTAVRHLLKDGRFSALNIFGLAAGLAICLFILAYVLDE